MTYKQYLIALTINISLSSLIFGQQTLKYTDPDMTYKNGIELFEKGKYGAAQKLFNDAVEACGNNYFDIKMHAEFYSALCAIELNNGDAEYLISDFIASYPESPQARRAYFEMGKFRYRQSLYSQAIMWFTKVEKSRLTKEERAEYFFKLGYSYFMTNDYISASKAFSEIKDIQTKYTAPAIYYFSHIAYTQKNYETALKGFQRLTEDETFSPVIPYYITQIYFYQKKYDQVISYAPSFLEKASTKRQPEIARIIGEAYVRKKMYKEALPYLKIFDEKSTRKTREDHYELAYTYYMLGDCNEAITYFESITGEKDAISQNAYYHLADCYLKTNQKEKAAIAFSAAANMDFDNLIKEDALFNYAKLSFEQKYNPFNNAIQALTEYINLYPGTSRTEEAYNYLTMAYLSTKNYKAAFESLEKTSMRDNQIREVFQKITYFRAIELLTNKEYSQAIEIFQKSLKYPLNKIIKALTYYWMGEAYYNLLNFNNAIECYSEFVLSPGAIDQNEYYIAHYNLGYCYFKLKDYTSSMIWFRKFTNNQGSYSNEVVADAYNRIGDCFFALRTYWQAIDNYDKAVSLKSSSSDYSLFQRAKCFSLLDRPEKRINTLEDLVKNYLNSDYYDDALFELGNAYLENNNIQKAEENYLKLYQYNPSGNYGRKASLQLGLIYYNQNRFDEAITCYKKLIADFPQSEEALGALNGLKNVYIEINKVDEYFSYIQKIGKASQLQTSEQDSITYLAAEKVYMSGDCNNAINGFTNYLNKYPNGNFVVNAHFYKAECNYLQKNYKDAQISFEYVVNKGKTSFNEQALIRLADIYLRQENYANAYETYLKLETQAENKSVIYDALNGQFRSAVKLNDEIKIMEASNKLLNQPNISKDLSNEISYNKAKIFFNQKQYDKAYEEFKKVADMTLTKQGAESKYMIARILFLQNKPDAAKQEILNFISKGTSHQYWLGKSFLLLAEIYRSKNDIFQAKATLQSLVDNYTISNDGIIDEAITLLKEIVDNENKIKYPGKEEDIELKFNQIDNSDNKI